MPSPSRSPFLVPALVAVSLGCGILASQLGLVPFLAAPAARADDPESPPGKRSGPAPGDKQKAAAAPKKQGGPARRGNKKKTGRKNRKNRKNSGRAGLAKRGPGQKGKGQKGKGRKGQGNKTNGQKGKAQGEPSRPPGFWHPSTLQQTTGQQPPPSLTELAKLPYARGFKEATDRPTITVHEPEAHDGLNLVLSAHAPEALLQDMKGDTLHRWSYDFEDVWPGPLEFFERSQCKEYWPRAHLFSNGDLLAIFEGIGMIKLDKDSNLLWSYKGRCHHDLFVSDAGLIYTLTRQDHEPDQRIQYKGKSLRDGKTIREDFVTVLTAEGKEVRKISLFDCFLRSSYAAMLPTTTRVSDVLHANYVDILDGSHADRFPVFSKGRALVSLRNNNAIAVVDLEQQKVVWALADVWIRQHYPTVVGDGNILLFDNLGARGGANRRQARSRVIEFDPATQEMVWSYEGTANDPFLCPIIGACRRLPNGNTLITDSVNGRAFEVTRDNRKVWEFHSPHRTGEKNEFVATLSEIVRIETDYPKFDFHSRR